MHHYRFYLGISSFHRSFVTYQKMVSTHAPQFRTEVSLLRNYRSIIIIFSNGCPKIVSCCCFINPVSRLLRVGSLYKHIVASHPFLLSATSCTWTILSFIQELPCAAICELRRPFSKHLRLLLGFREWPPSPRSPRYHNSSNLPHHYFDSQSMAILDFPFLCYHSLGTQEFDFHPFVRTT